MVYRIRFRDAAATGESEATVEANSPTEALVKFRCVYNCREYAHSSVTAEVTSVQEDVLATG